MNMVNSAVAFDESMEPTRLDSPFVIYRLEEAGATLLALPNSGYSPRLRLSQLEVVHTALEAYGWERGRIRPPVPTASRISRMDEALSWIRLIPDERYVLRRIVGARSLVSPITERHLYSWRRLGSVLSADHKAVQRWHAQAVDMIVAALGALRRAESAGSGYSPARCAAPSVTARPPRG